MKNSLTTKSILVISAIMPMTSCVDDKYDLSDIESTARIEVKDLMVPINLDVISLENIIEIEEGKAVEIVDGQYAIV